MKITGIPQGTNFTLMLQRLANPHLPAQPDPNKNSALTPYNPYVTVDYADNLTPINAIMPMSVNGSTVTTVFPTASPPAPLIKVNIPPQGRTIRFRSLTWEALPPSP